MPRWLKISLIVVGCILLLPVLLWVGVSVYISSNKQHLLQQITTKFNNRMNGRLTIRDMDASLIRGFPGVSVSFSDVLLRDSMYSTHHRDLLKAKEVFVSLNAMSLVRGTPTIRNIHIVGGGIHIFVDSTGYSNASIFDRQPDADTSHRITDLHLGHILFSDITATFESHKKFKLFQFDVHSMETILDYNNTGWYGSIQMDAFVKSFAFNTARGSYMKDKNLNMHITVAYNKQTKTLTVPEQAIKIGTDDLKLAAQFYFSSFPGNFNLHISAPAIPFRNAASMLSPNIATSINNINLKNPVNVTANISGAMKFRDTPLVHVSWLVQDNTLLTPIGDISNCNFEGYFDNEVLAGMGHSDNNSIIRIYGMRGNWQQLPFSADTVTVNNLKRPVIEGHIKSRFPLAKLNPIIGGKVLIFSKGEGLLNIKYKGALRNDDTTSPYIQGALQVVNGTLTYTPRKLVFTNTNASLKFSGQDLLVQKTSVQLGTSKYLMEGNLQNFLNFYYHDPTKIVLNWRISSQNIDLKEFRTFLAHRHLNKPPVRDTKKPMNRYINHLSKQMDDMLTSGNVHISLRADTVDYGRFMATDLDADVRLGRKGIDVSHAELSHASGKLAVSGSLYNNGNLNNYHVIATAGDVDIKRFFRAFDNFGQDGLTDKNLSGRLNAHMNVTGSLMDDGTALTRSVNGTVDYDLRNGTLTDFEPFRVIGKYLFRKRNLSHITFGNLKNKLDIRQDKIIIEPMTVNTSAFNVHVKGVYSLTTGTNIDIELPLRNPKKDAPDLDLDHLPRRQRKGVTLYFKAADDEDGKVRIKMITK